MGISEAVTALSRCVPLQRCIQPPLPPTPSTEGEPRRSADFKPSPTIGYSEGVFPLPPDEEERMKVLKSLSILDTSAEASFDHIADWCRSCFDVPISLVTLVDTNRQWFKACYGLDVNQTGRDAAFCAHAIMPGMPEIFEVPNAQADPRFANNPLVTGSPHIRYYAGAPIRFEGRKLGTLCIIDVKPRKALDAYHRSMLVKLAAIVSDQLGSRLMSNRLQAMFTELESHNAEIVRQHNELQTLMDTANAPIFAVDTGGRITAWNRKISELTSLPTSKVMGQTINHLFEGSSSSVWSNAASGSGSNSAESENSARVEAAFQNAAVHGQRCTNLELEMRSQVHGRLVQLQVSIEPKRDADGKVVGAVCVGEDVAVQRRMLAATTQNYQLQRTNEAKDTFLAVMSHEMRTPLNGLLGMLQLASQVDDEVSDRVARYIKQAKNSGTLLLHLINDILDITRIREGQLQLEETALSVDEIVNETIETVRPKALEKALELKLEVDDGLRGLTLLGDSMRIRQILLNLIWNALKFTHEGSVSLTARATSFGEEDVQVLLEVLDTGAGIADDEQPFVFNRFTLGTAGEAVGDAGTFKHRKEDRKDKGVGLGMSICKQLVDLMGGQIWLQSTVGMGTRVMVQIPLKRVQPPTNGTKAKATNGACAAAAKEDATLRPSPVLCVPANRTAAEVLLVEDNDYNVDVAKQMLEFLGHTVTVAFNGKEAIDHIISRDRAGRMTPSGLPFDIVLMDCSMPVMNGFEATRAVRRWERQGVPPPPTVEVNGEKVLSPVEMPAEVPPQRPPIPIIAVTAYAMLGDKEACFDAGMDDYVTKPLMLPTLRDTIAVQLASAQHQTAVTRSAVGLEPRPGQAALASASSASSSVTPGTVAATANGKTSSHSAPPVRRLSSGSGIIDRIQMLDNPLVRQLRDKGGSDLPRDLPANVVERARAASGGVAGNTAQSSSGVDVAMDLPPMSLEELIATDSFWSLQCLPEPTDLPQLSLSQSPAAAPASARVAADGVGSPDLKEMAQVFGGNADLLRMALARFDTNIFARIREPWEAQDFKRVGMLAHQWKGTCSYISCANSAQRAALQLEQSAKALANAPESIHLKREVTTALYELQVSLHRVGPVVEAAVDKLNAWKEASN